MKKVKVLNYDVEIKDIRMYLAPGHGKYSIITDFSVTDEDGKEHSLVAKVLSTDSELWDEDEKAPEMLFDRAFSDIQKSIEDSIEKSID